MKEKKMDQSFSCKGTGEGDRKMFWTLRPSLFIFSLDPPSFIIIFFWRNPPPSLRNYFQNPPYVIIYACIFNIKYRVRSPSFINYFCFPPSLLHYIFSFSHHPLLASVWLGRRRVAWRLFFGGDRARTVLNGISLTTTSNVLQPLHEIDYLSFSHGFVRPKLPMFNSKVKIRSI